MRFLFLPVLLAGVLFVPLTLDRPEPEPPEGVEIFVGRLVLLDGDRIEHSQLKVRIFGKNGIKSPRNYKLSLECEDWGQRFRPPPGEEGRSDLWGSFYGGMDEQLGEIARPEYRCPADDPARFNRATEVLSHRTTLDFEPDHHAEFRSSAGLVRFEWAPDPMIL